MVLRCGQHAWVGNGVVTQVHCGYLGKCIQKIGTEWSHRTLMSREDVSHFWCCQFGKKSCDPQCCPFPSSKSLSDLADTHQSGVALVGLFLYAVLEIGSDKRWE
ncbi:hypothetical protein HBI56_232660 [Parastagonospora nodorum]|uniref:Uncharacterized protein n=1 Tax=Phaeosphaeria nodorum (strain SN15 / ATCC MYA-4574 / FGSC 10173) TaxID=321614 RepID=A0A7U2F8N1_PHANO|nr:hypothetical protein HBH56_200560 [Parastagonospora nodorum]QRD00788.1 hypothetical protein JI435_306540 [Parastagonospora nodorum SN15]KAH3925931.1 hypothetical protein HBH54_175750 [Parastagonospora nodorum]KAH3953166.1 hypothetical protein HBH53_037130 [Parastagonospora nodorum]KAH3976546.1 hypothetical protein HBH52_121550 [Parastagonospora nodorum]